jgi:hypothetical protein
MPAELPSVTSLQCVDALRRLGFEIDSVDERIVKLLGPDGRRVFVRRHTTLARGELFAILMVARVGTEDFLDALARAGSGTRRVGEISGVVERDGGEGGTTRARSSR